MKPCLKCDYDLTGLPDEHTCPECGFTYDSENVAVDLRYRPSGLLIRIAIFAMAALPLCFFFGSLENVVLLWAWVWQIAWLTGFHLYCMRARRKLEPKLILNRSGIHVARSFHDIEFWPWEVVGEAKHSWVTGRMTIQNACGDAVFFLPIRETGKLKTARQCATEIMRLKELYAAREVDANP